MLPSMERRVARLDTRGTMGSSKCLSRQAMRSYIPRPPSRTAVLAVQRESLDAAAAAAQDAMDAADAAREQSLKANFQVSEIQDLAALELEELCRDKRQEEWEDRLLVMGHAAVDKHSPLHDVPLSILLRSQRASGSRGCGDCGSRGGGESGASWGPRVSRNRRFALPSFHENVAPYAPPHVGISSMRFVPDLTSSRVPTRLTSRPKAAARIEI